MYRDLGIPADAWAPNFLHERGADALWCNLCTEAELGGQSRLGALGEVAGDVVDDLTGEVFDLGSGPSEGAARRPSWPTIFSSTACCRAPLARSSPTSCSLAQVPSRLARCCIK